MTINWWTLGLQAVNVLILVWLLSRLFWKPLAGAIAKRQESANAVTETARATQAKADAALAEATQARADIAAERAMVLDAARGEVEAASKAALAAARTSADAMLAAAKTKVAHDAETARKANAEHASDLSLKIAARLLRRLDGPAVQMAFLSQLVEAIASIPAADRAALVADPNGIEIVTATDAGAERAKIEKEVRAALGGSPSLRFVINPDLIAGAELRSPHFVLRNSWQTDLNQVRKAVKDAT